MFDFKDVNNESGVEKIAQQISVQELSDGTKIEYCLKPNCLRLIAPDDVQSPE